MFSDNEFCEGAVGCLYFFPMLRFSKEILFLLLKLEDVVIPLWTLSLILGLRTYFQESHCGMLEVRKKMWWDFDAQRQNTTRNLPKDGIKLLTPDRGITGRVAVKKMMQGRWLCAFHCHLGRQWMMSGAEEDMKELKWRKRKGIKY